MTDREKVIKALQTCSVQNDVGCQCCPYFEERKTYGHEWCTTSMAQDALTMLKEQQSKTGHWIPWQPDSYVGSETFTCSYCRNNTKHPYPTKTPDEYLFCPYCGAKMET